MRAWICPLFYLVRCVDFFITVKKCRQEATIYERRRASTSIISRAWTRTLKMRMFSLRLWSIYCSRFSSSYCSECLGIIYLYTPGGAIWAHWTCLGMHRRLYQNSMSERNEAYSSTGLCTFSVGCLTSWMFRIRSWWTRVDSMPWCIYELLSSERSYLYRLLF